ncbi:hypothetical protein WA158_002264 [Blastocystis sp. Blastoise]
MRSWDFYFSTPPRWITLTKLISFLILSCISLSVGSIAINDNCSTILAIWCIIYGFLLLFLVGGDLWCYSLETESPSKYKFPALVLFSVSLISILNNLLSFIHTESDLDI